MSGTLARHSFSSRVSCYLQAVSAQLHAAPAPGTFLAGIEKMQNTLPTLAEPASISLGEQLCESLSKGSE